MYLPRTYNALYYPKFPLNKVVPGVSRMDDDEYLSLVESIAENGMLNPLVIEHEGPEYIVVVGHNRWKVVTEEFHWTHAKAIVISRLGGELLDGGVRIPSEEFERTMGELHSHDDTWKQSHFALRACKRAAQID